MQVVAPNRITITATREADESWSVVHREHFDAHDTGAFEATLAFLREHPQAGVTGRRVGDGIEVRYRGCSRERAGNIICMEFLQWSTVGEMKLRDIIMSAFCGGANAPVEDPTSGREGR